jgi:hypothetical protein
MRKAWCFLCLVVPVIAWLVQEGTPMAQVHHARPIDYEHVLRVTIAYDGDRLSIARVTRVAMRAPAPATPPPHEHQAGYWLELRDAHGSVLYHRPLYDPLRRDVEVFGDKPGDPIRRVPARHDRGEFDVLLPELPQATDFVLHGPPAGKPAAPSGALYRHGMAELRQLVGHSTQGSTP